MAKPYRIREAQIACKVEATPGTAETLSTADMFVASDIVLTPQFQDTPNESLTGVPDREQGTTGTRSGTLAFKLPLKGSGVAGTAPEFGEALKSCGWSETIVGGTSVTYKPAAAETYYTFGLLFPGLGGAGEDILFRLAGCQSAPKLTFKNGEPLYIEIAATGAWIDPTDSTLLTPPTWDTSVPFAFLAPAMTFHGVSGLAFETLAIDFGHEVSMRPSPNAANGSGILTGQIGGRRPTFTVDIEVEKLASFNLFDRLKNNTTGAISMSAIGTAGNLVDLDLPKVRFNGTGLGDRAGALIYSASGEILRSGNAGLDSHSLIFT